ADLLAPRRSVARGRKARWPFRRPIGPQVRARAGAPPTGWSVGVDGTRTPSRAATTPPQRPVRRVAGAAPPAPARAPDPLADPSAPHHLASIDPAPRQSRPGWPDGR